MQHARKDVTSSAAAVALAMAVAAALAGLTACQRNDRGSVFAADAHASTLTSPPASLTAAEGDVAAPAGGTSAKTERHLGSMPSLSPLVKQLRPVVVNISTTMKSKAVASRRRLGRQQPRRQTPDDEDDSQGGQDPMQRFFEQFGNPNGGGQGMPNMRTPERHGLGSGFIIGDGLVLTNNHVTEGADEIKVTTDPTAPGGTREFTGKVIGRDAQTDIALVQLDGARAKELPAAVLGSSEAMEVGDYVVAIGEPFGFQATVTSGIISAKERSLRTSPFDDFIQTDASINPGNSGGPLFNLKGEVIGVNTAIISGANSIGFAIPIDLVKQEIAQLKAKGRVTRGFLGVQVQPVTQEIAETLGLKTTEGALIADVVRTGEAPAAKAGLKPGDVIVGVNGKSIRDERHLTRTVASYTPGTVIKLDVLRDKQPKELDLKIGTRPDEPDESDPRGLGRGDNDDSKGSDPLGLSVEDITPDLARRAQLDKGLKGAIVTEVGQDGPASQFVEPGDVIVEVNRQPVESAADYKKAVKGLKKGDTALLRTLGRGGGRYQTVHVK